MGTSAGTLTNSGSTLQITRLASRLNTDEIVLAELGEDERTAVPVSQLASAAQRTFTFTSPASADPITIDGNQVSLAAGATSQDLAHPAVTGAGAAAASRAA